MPSSIRASVTKAVKSLIEAKPTNEEFRLLAFGAEIVELQGFSADRYDLATATEKINFADKQSMIYDAIYNTIPTLAPLDGKAVFYRTIVFTDGADDTATGITREELFLRLQTEHYPIDVVDVASSEVDGNKDLSAIVRMSDGRYFILGTNTDTAALANDMGVQNYT
jgi:hypothetical protein